MFSFTRALIAVTVILLCAAGCKQTTGINTIDESAEENIHLKEPYIPGLQVYAPLQFGSHETLSCDPWGAGGLCGTCPGMCPEQGFTIGALTPSQINNGYAYLYLEMVNNDLKIVFDGDVDFGNGTVLVLYDFTIGPSVSSALGYTDIVIKAGSYVINYSNYTHGESTFDVDLIP